MYSEPVRESKKEIPVYISDMANARIREVNPSGIITTVAGSGQTGSSGDGGPATAARLNWPTGLAADVAGSLYIADSLSDRIRKLITAPTPTTGCMYSLDAPGRSFEPAGGTGSVAVSTNQAGCRWLAGSYVDWVTVTAGSSGTGTGSVSYSVAPNDSSASRSGSLWVAGRVSRSLRPASPALTPSGPTTLPLPPVERSATQSSWPRARPIAAGAYRGFPAGSGSAAEPAAWAVRL